MHNAGFAASRPERRLPAARGGGRRRLRARSPAACGLRGASITAPFKVRLDGRGRRARSARARGSARSTRSPCATDGGSATNTDVDGFPAPLRRRMSRCAGAPRVDPRRRRRGARRSPSRSPTLGAASPSARGGPRRRATIAALVAGGTVGDLPPPPGSWDVLVNARRVGSGDAATSTPMAGAALDGGSSSTSSTCPPDTGLMADARAAGCDRSAGSRCWSRRRSGSSSSGPASAPPPGSSAAAAAATDRAIHEDMKQTRSKSSWSWRGAARSCRWSRRSSRTC